MKLDTPLATGNTAKIYLQQVLSRISSYVFTSLLSKSHISKEEIFQWAPIIAGARLSENVSSGNVERN